MDARFTLAVRVMSRMETRSRPCSPNNSSATSRIRDLVSQGFFIHSFETNVLNGVSCQLCIPDYFQRAATCPDSELSRGQSVFGVRFHSPAPLITKSLQLDARLCRKRSPNLHRTVIRAK